MDPGHRAAAGVGLAGVGSLAVIAGGASQFGLADWMLGTALGGAGLLVAALGLAGLHYGHGHGLAALALGCAVLAFGGVADLLYTLAWEGRRGLSIAGSLVFAAGALQCAWYGALWATRPEGPRTAAAAGLRLGLGTAAVGALLLLVSDVEDAGSVAAVPGYALTTLGLLLAARTRGLATVGVDAAPPGPRRTGAE